MSSGKAVAILAATLLKIFKPKEIVSPADWVEKNIRLDAKTSPTLAGRYSLRHTPYLKQIYEDVGNPRVPKIIVKKAAQTGLTQFANNVVLYYVCNHTFPCLMIMPSKEAAQQFCERSLTPTIFNSGAVKQFITSNPDDLKKTEYLFKSCIVRVIGAGSPSKLASNPAVLAIIDEADKMDDFATQGEAPALELAEDRTITFPNDKKIIVLSTPTTANTSVVQSQYNAYITWEGSSAYLAWLNNTIYLGADVTVQGTLYGDWGDGNAVQFAGGFISNGTVTMNSLPTSDPASAGELWNDSGLLRVSAG